MSMGAVVFCVVALALMLTVSWRFTLVFLFWLAVVGVAVPAAVAVAVVGAWQGYALFTGGDMTLWGGLAYFVTLFSAAWLSDRLF